MYKACTICPHCEHPPKLDVQAIPMGYQVICQCYDGAPDAGRQLVGYGSTKQLAVADWHETALNRQEELANDNDPVHILRIQIARALRWTHKAYATAHKQEIPERALVEISRAQEHLGRAMTIADKEREH